MNKKLDKVDNESVIDKFNNFEKKLKEDKDKLESTKDKKSDKTAEDKETKETKEPEQKKTETTEDKKPEKKAEPAKEETKQEPSKEQAKSKEPKAEASEGEKQETNVKAASANLESKDEVNKSEDGFETEHSVSHGVVNLSNDNAEKLIDILQKSYDMVTERLNATDNSVTSIKSTLDSMQSTLIPFVSKAMKVLPEADEVPKSTDTNSPEDEAIKSANLEDRQHTETISKSAGAKDDSKEAVEKSTSVVDEVMQNQSTDIKTQQEKPKDNLTSDDLRVAAFSLTGDFFNKVRKGVSDGNIQPNEVRGYQNMQSRIQTGEASDDEVKKFIDFASSK